MEYAGGYSDMLAQRGSGVSKKDAPRKQSGTQENPSQKPQQVAPDRKRMANALMQQEQAVVSTSGAPLSMKDPESWPKCFLEFFYGDAVPNMTKRGEKGTGFG